jgi:hypothetical protein
VKRRDFLKTPAYGILLGSNIGSTALSQPRSLRKRSRTEDEAQQEIEQRMHPDFITYFPGIEYFYVGNGDITGAVQHSPKDAQASFLGFTLMDPERFCRKWSTFLYHPERGFGATKLGVAINEASPAVDAKSGMFHGVRGFSVSPENFRSIRWKYVDRVPVVSLIWNAGDCEVEEEFFVPSEGAILFRRVNVKNLSKSDLEVGLSLSLYANFGLFDEISTDERENIARADGLCRMKLFSLERNVNVSGRYEVKLDLGTVPKDGLKQGTYVYSINNGEKLLKRKTPGTLWDETKTSWEEKSSFKSGSQILDPLFNVSKSGMKWVQSRKGKMDAGPWMYNMEWISDQVLAVEAMLRVGMVREAKVMLEKNLQHGIGFDGRTIESSRWFGYDYTEVNQNGCVLYGLWAYVCWTGDYGMIKKHWSKIKLCAEFPLKEVFLDKRTKMVRNKREFWERSDSHGIEDGYEMAYQFWVSFGLEKGAELAEAIGEKKIAQRWRSAAGEMKAAMLGDPEFKLIEDGHLIKRRTRDGRWQRYTVPPDRERMPPGSPLATEKQPSLEPDSIESLPIIFEVIDPTSDLALNTLRWIEQLWNQQWEGGGYPRYNVTSEDNPPAPWPIPSALIARAYVAAGDDEKVWRVLEWLKNVHGGDSGSWFERYGQSITPPMPPVNVVGWIWYEIIALCVHHIAGVRPELTELVLRPHVLQGINEIKTTHTIRGSKLRLTVRKSKDKNFALVNGKRLELKDGSLRVPYPRRGDLQIEIEYRG